MNEIKKVTKHTVKIGDCQGCPHHGYEQDMNCRIPWCHFANEPVGNSRCPLTKGSTRYIKITEITVEDNPGYKWEDPKDKVVEYEGIQEREDRIFMEILEKRKEK